MEECKFAAEYIHKQVKDPKVFMSAFCGQKNLTNI